MKNILSQGMKLFNNFTDSIQVEKYVGYIDNILVRTKDAFIQKNPIQKTQALQQQIIDLQLRLEQKDQHLKIFISTSIILFTLLILFMTRFFINSYRHYKKINNKNKSQKIIFKKIQPNIVYGLLLFNDGSGVFGPQQKDFHFSDNFEEILLFKSQIKNCNKIECEIEEDFIQFQLIEE